MIQLSERIMAMEESATIAMSKKSRELKAAGKDVISLSLGEPDFHTPQFIKDAAAKAMADNFTTYTPVSGYEDLRDAIAYKLKRDNGLDYTADQIVVSTGAKQSIANVMLSILNDGDEVVIPAPYWVSYVEMAKMAGGVPVTPSAGIETDFKISPRLLEENLNDKSRLLIFSSPCNPTGSVYSKKELAALAEVIAKYPKLVVVSDEIYEHINFESKHESLAQFDHIANQVVTVNGVSKAWAMTGWRLGYIAAPKEIAKACDKVQGQFTSGTCSITQKATVAAMMADPEVLKDMVAAFKNRRQLVYDRLKKMPGVKVNMPEGAFYFFPDISSFFGKSAEGQNIQNATDLCMYLLEHANVAVVTGDAFGNPSCMRLSYATSEKVLEEAMNRIESALAKLV